jgi:uncharacterized protein
MIDRIFTLPLEHSFFLFGPRGTGKTTLLQNFLPQDSTEFVNLLDLDTELYYMSQPKAFFEFLSNLPDSIEWVVIDEVQKVPQLLDEVHRHIEEHPKRYFALTGSSARKLRRGQANLLAGRAFNYHLFPLTVRELGDRFDLQSALEFGTLPQIFSLASDKHKSEFLRSYAGVYLKEEIKSEALVRNLLGFQRFLRLVGLENGFPLSWTNLARECGIDSRTIQSYFEILDDTLMGFFLPAYHRSIRKQQKSHPKFYLFDTGVRRSLAGELSSPLIPGTSEYGRAFEHFWVTELVRMNDYLRLDWVFSYFATANIEIDLVIERPNKPLLFVEFKSSERVKDRELKPLESLVESVAGSEGICVCREPRSRRRNRILVCPWQEMLSNLF